MNIQDQIAQIIAVLADITVRLDKLEAPKPAAKKPKAEPAAP